MECPAECLKVDDAVLLGDCMLLAYISETLCNVGRVLIGQGTTLSNCLSGCFYVAIRFTSISFYFSELQHNWNKIGAS